VSEHVKRSELRSTHTVKASHTEEEGKKDITVWRREERWSGKSRGMTHAREMWPHSMRSEERNEPIARATTWEKDALKAPNAFFGWRVERARRVHASMPIM
jgi:hypothetical protein